MLELRTLTWFLATRGKKIGLDAVPSAPLVEGLLAEWGQEKRKGSKKREHVDCDQLIAGGTWLSRQDQARLTKELKAYFTFERLNPATTPTTGDAWQFQRHLVLHLLNDDVIAVPRSELLSSLQRGITLGVC